jgi:hypothetical protein
MKEDTMTRRKLQPRPSEQPLIIQYTNLLHQFRGPNAIEVRAFIDQHEDDTIFVRRANIINALFLLNAAFSGVDIDRAIDKEENKGMEGRR